MNKQGRPFRWRQSDRPAEAVSATDHTVLALTKVLNRQAAEEVVAQVQLIDERTPIVVDLTAVPAFDSDGILVLSDLQDQLGGERLTMVGLRQASARLMNVMPGGDAPTPVTGATSQLPITRLHHTTVVHPLGDVVAADLETALSLCMADDVAIVVADFREAGALDGSVIEVLAFASSEAAVRGCELLVVNVSAADLAALKRCGLSATTFVAAGDQPED